MLLTTFVNHIVLALESALTRQQYFDRGPGRDVSTWLDGCVYNIVRRQNVIAFDKALTRCQCF